jgi:putative transposase
MKQVVQVRLQANAAQLDMRCTQCGYIDSGNRTSQAEFVCRDCGFIAEHADTWAQSTAPSAA